MIIRAAILSSIALVASAAFVSPAAALTMKECSVKYQAAKADGSAGDIKWSDYRARFCGAEVVAKEAASDTKSAVAAVKAPEKPAAKAPKGVVFPSAVDSKYSGETPAKARMKTCSDSYRKNKSEGTLGDLKWIEKGGGFWSLCNTGLKS